LLEQNQKLVTEVADAKFNGQKAANWFSRQNSNNMGTFDSPTKTGEQIMERMAEIFDGDSGNGVPRSDKETIEMLKDTILGLKDQMEMADNRRRNSEQDLISDFTIKLRDSQKDIGLGKMERKTLESGFKDAEECIAKLSQENESLIGRICAKDQEFDDRTRALEENSLQLQSLVDSQKKQMVELEQA
jgi:hypothetical protein